MPVPGGPIVPVTTVKSPDTVPVEPVVTRSFEGLVQPTGTLLPNTLMVGSPGAALHSRIPPVELSWKPLPDTASTMLALRQVAGSTLSVAPLVVTDPTDGVQLVGAVVVVVEDGEVVDDVVVVLGADSPSNKMPAAASPLAAGGFANSMKAITQVTPAACCAGVGGQG